MAETLPPEAFNIAAFEGKVLIEAPGVVATVDVETASFLSDQLLAACGSARLQQHRAIIQRRNDFCPTRSDIPET